MNSNLKTLIILASSPLVLGIALSGANSAKAATIDGFDVTQFLQTSSVTSTNNTVNDPGNSFLGNTRKLTITQTGQTIAGAGFQTGINTPQASLFNLIDNTGAQGNVMIEYFGTGGSPNAFAPVDLTDGGLSNSIAFNVLGNPVDAYSAIITVRSVGGSNVIRTASNLADAAITYYNFSNFAGVDFTKIEYLKFQFNGRPGINLTLDFLASAPDPNNPPTPIQPQGTPEPGTMLGLVAVAGFGFLSRKKKYNC